MEENKKDRVLKNKQGREESEQSGLSFIYDWVSDLKMQVENLRRQMALHGKECREGVFAKASRTPPVSTTNRAGCVPFYYRVSYISITFKSAAAAVKGSLACSICYVLEFRFCVMWCYLFIKKKIAMCLMGQNGRPSLALTQ